MLVGEAFLSAALGALCDRIASLPVLDFFKSTQLKDPLLTKLKNKMITIYRVLEDAEDKRHTDSSVKQWHDELKHVVYDAEDLLDEIASKVQRSEIEAESQTILEKMQDFASPLKPFKTAINKKLEEILTTLEDLVGQKDALGLMGGTGGKPSYQRTQTSSIPDEYVIYGRDDDKEAIMKWVLSDHPNISNPNALAIVGHGGLGKTTLAQHVYRRVPDCFDKKSWVCVAEEFDVFKVTKDILVGFTGKSSDANNLDQLQSRLMSVLTDQKIFLVLDDVWNRDYQKWEYLLKPLRSGKEGSKILLTTRDEAVANLASTIYQLQKLSDNDCWSLFEKHAFMGTGASSAHPNLESIGRKMAEKCDGLPLAAKLLGGALKSNRDPRKWMEILESGMWNLHNENVLPVLKLSFQFLPSQQKRCFAYCALFPKDFKFGKKLIRLWMAEGLLTQSKGNEDIEQVGVGCFNDLVSRSFFQYSTESECFVMHDLINDLAKSISGEFCFRYGVDRKCEISERIRHLWVGDAEEYEVDKLISKVQHLRTLLCFRYGKNEVMNLLPTFTRLRVLGLLCDKLPDSIGNLMHLRYVDLSWASIERLPDSVASLYNLETLILYNCFHLAELPETIFKLINLSQLDIRGTRLRKMPPHMGKLKKLGELDYYIVGEESHCSITELGPLKRLRGHLRIEKLGNVSHVQELEEANLKGKEKLKELELIWSDDEGSDVPSGHETKVLEQLQPHTNIEKLSIYGYPGRSFPDWVGDSSLSNMVELKLKRCKYCRSLPALGQLGSLKRLSIIKFEEITVVGTEFYGKSNKPPFGCLESLTFTGMRQWKEWVPYSNKDEGDGATAAFPLLQELVIKLCPNPIKTLPADLPSLKRVTINGCDLLESFPLDLGPALEEINIVECGNLKCLSIAAAELKHLKSLEIKYCPNLKDIQLTHLLSLRSVTIYGCDSLESFPLDLGPALEEINIWRCENLKCLSAAAAELEHLKFLKIECCPNLKEIQPTHLPSLKSVTIHNCDLLESFLLNLGPALEKINISSCENLKCLSAAAAAELEHLKSLEIKCCPNLKEIQPPHLPSLKSVTIDGCDLLESFSLDLGPTLEEINIERCENLKCLSAAAELEHLKSLEIKYCPNLKEIQPTHLPSLKRVTIDCCDLLESFLLNLGPTLEKINIGRCDNLECLSTAAAAELKHLKSLKIKYCPKLKEIQPTHLPSLKKVIIDNCDSLESFTLDLGPALKEIEIVNCGHLKCLSAAVELEHLRLHDCPKLQGIQPTHLPSLADLDIGRCDQLVSLPRAPALQRLWIEFHPLPEVVLDLFPLLEILSISDCPKLESLSTASQAPLQRLECLALRGCPNLKRLLSMHNCAESIGADLMSKIFPNLSHLSLGRCCEEVESFPPENMLLPPTLTSLHIGDFPNLKSFDNTALQSLACLQELRIYDCPKLQSLPKEGLPSSLQHVQIFGCSSLQVGQDGPEAEIANIQQKPRQSGTRSHFWHTSGPSAMLPEPPTQNQRKLMQGRRRKNLKLKEPWDKENELAPSIESGTEQHRSRTLSPRTEAEITNIQQEPMQSSTLSFLRQTGGPSAMLPEPPTQNQRKLMQGGMGLTTPPECQEWERSTEIHLMNNEFSELPETLICPVLETLLLNGNSRLRKIPESFFNNMPALQILNLSRTRIKSLPKSLFQLINLKRLFLNHCELFMRLQPEIGKLRNLEILDLEGTWITNLPKEVQHLKTLTCLKLSFDDPVNYRKELLNEVIPRGVLSALAQLEELHIDVSPDDKRWNACVVDVASEVCGLTTLNTLKFYFPLVELLSGFNWSNPEGESLSLSRFRLTVGHHFKRIMSRTPHDIELEMEQYHRCLKYVNGAGVPEEIKVVLRYATAFFLDRHTDIKTLSELGCENMMQLNWCVVGECNEIRAIINGDQMGSWSSSEKNIGLTALVYLHIYRMKNLRSIWEGRVLDNGFTSLKALTLCTCPQLTTIFTPELLASFGNLEELLVDDCPVITALVCCDNSEHEATHFLPKLKKVSLHYLPELASISNAKGISMLPTVEWMSVYCCPKLLCLPIDKGYHTSLKKIKGERNWWEALEWTSTQQHSWDDIFVPINACD